MTDLETKDSRQRARRREAALARLEKKQGSRRTAILGGTTSLVAIAGVTVAASLWLPAVPEMDTAAKVADLPAVPTLNVCPGTPKLPTGSDTTEDIGFSPVSSDAAWAMSVATTSDLAGNIAGITYVPATPDADAEHTPTDITDPLPEELQQGPPATAATDGTVVQHSHYQVVNEPDQHGQPVAVTIQPVGGSPANAHVSVQYAATDGDLAGMTVANCTPAAHQHWLTGAVTSTGTTAVLTLTNPSATNSTVDLTVHDTTGRTAVSGATGIVLAPGQTRSMLVAGFAPSEDSVTLGVSASGGAVTTNIQQHRLDGIVPAGVETIQPAATGSSLIIPGLVIDEDVQDIANASGLGGQHPTLHIAATASAVSATISVRGPDGPIDIPAEASAVELRAGATTTVDLGALEPGTYSVEIDANATITAQASSVAFNPAADNEDASSNTQAVDTAYMPSTTALRGETMVALPALGNPEQELILTSKNDATVQLTPITEDGEHGETRTQEIAANTTVTLATDDAAAYQISTADNTVHAGVFVTSTAGISALPINSVPTNSAGLPIRLGY